MLRVINFVYKHVGGKGQGSEENMAPHLYKTNQLDHQQQTTPSVATQNRSGCYSSDRHLLNRRHF